MVCIEYCYDRFDWCGNISRKTQHYRLLWDCTGDDKCHTALFMKEKEKPLFIPLYTQWYEEFANGTKTVEFRNYGPRWNEKTCRIGRKVTISKGYGKKNRLYGVVKGFKRVISGPTHAQADEAQIEIKLNK